MNTDVLFWAIPVFVMVWVVWAILGLWRGYFGRLAAGGLGTVMLWAYGAARVTLATCAVMAAASMAVLCPRARREGRA